MPHPRRRDRPGLPQVIADLLAVNALFRLRAAQGVLGLADKHSPARLEAACAKAIAVGDPSYRTVKGILAAGAETDPPPPSAGDGGAAAHLHGPSQLFANVIPLPTTNAGPATDPATTNGHRDGPGDDERPDAGDGGAGMTDTTSTSPQQPAYPLPAPADNDPRSPTA